MTVPLTTRGIICQKSSQAIAINSWGFLCFNIRTFTQDDVGFIFGRPTPTCDVIYNKKTPLLYDSPNVGLFAAPRTLLTGRKTATLLGSTGLNMMSSKNPSLYNKAEAQLTGAHVVKLVGNREVLLSEPEEPTLTSSGTKVPDLINKC